MRTHVAGKRVWTEDEIEFLHARIRRMPVASIAHAIGRSEKAVRKCMERRRLSPTRDEWITSGLASEATGIPAWKLRAMARRGEIRARKVPGGSWWMFDPGDFVE